MDVLHYRRVTLLISVILAITVASCERATTDNVSNILYIDVYGTCEEHIKLFIDDEVIYEAKADPSHRLLSARKGPLIFHRKEINLRLCIDEKDTVLTRVLDYKNYWLFGYSKIRNEFQFSTYDSAQFFRPTLDNDIVEGTER